MRSRPLRGAWMTVALMALVASVLTVTSSAAAETASSAVRSAQAGLLDAGEEHTCAVLADRTEPSSRIAQVWAEPAVMAAARRPAPRWTGGAKAGEVTLTVLP